MTINALNSSSFEDSYGTPLIQDASKNEQKHVRRYKLARLRGCSVKHLCSKTLKGFSSAAGRHKEAIKKALIITGIALAIIAAVTTCCVLAPWTLLIAIPVIIMSGGVLAIIKGKDNYFTPPNMPAGIRAGEKDNSKPVMIWGEEEKNWWEIVYI